MLEKLLLTTRKWQLFALALGALALLPSAIISPAREGRILPPVALPDVANTNEDTPVTFDVVGNDTDPDLAGIDAATVDLDLSTAGIQNTVTVTDGSFSVDNAGQVTFIPNLNFNGVVITSYTVNDVEALTSLPATITVTVNDVNDLPTAVDDAAVTNEDTPVNVTVVTNDTDVDGTINPATVDLDPATPGIQDSFGVSNGSFDVDASGVVTFTPTLNYNGPVAITYTVNDNDGDTSNAANLTITVTDVNDAPVAVNDNTSTVEDTPVAFDVTSNDSDADGTLNKATVDFDAATAGVQSTASNAGGNFSASPAGIVTFTPTGNYSGPASITYTIQDDDGAVSNSATFSITVTAANDAPVAVNDTGTTPEDTPFVLNVVSNDTDIDGTVDASTVDLDPVTAGKQTSVNVTGGSFSVNAAGDVTYTPTLNYNGSAAASYVVNDDGATVSNAATITITVTAVNDPPVAFADNTTTSEDTPVTINVVSNDTDVDGTINAASVDLDTSTGGIQNAATTPEGDWSVDGSGNVTFTPVTDFTGPAARMYTVNDNGGAMSNAVAISINVTAVNDPPVAVNDNTTTNEDTPISINVVANDTDSDGTVAASTVDLDPAVGGIQSSSTTATGTFTVDGAGLVTYTPLANYFGPATRTYTVNDNGGATSNVATLSITVTAVNDAPVAVADNTTTPEDTPVTINVVFNDTDVDGTINAASVDLDTSSGGIQSTATTAEGGWAVDGSGNVTFTPVSDFTGPATRMYTVNDNGGATSNAVAILVTVTAVNDPPVAVNDNTSTNEDTPVSINVVANDTDSDGTVSASTVDLDPAVGGIQSSSTTATGTFTVNTAGLVTYTPIANYFGPATRTYTVNDNGGATSNIATLTVTVNAVNDPPVAVNDNTTTNEDVPVSLTVTANDTDVDGTVNTATVDLDPSIGGIQSSSTTAQGTFVSDGAGSVTFTPVLNFTGNATRTYTVNDNSGATSNAATITMSVISVNDPPVANNDNASTNEDTPVSFNVVSNDTDADGSVMANSVDMDPSTPGGQNSITTGQGTFTVNGSGSVTFTPILNFFGVATTGYTVNDNGGATSNVATITVTVNSVNDPPVAVNDNSTTNEDAPVTFNIASNDTDLDGTIDASTADLDVSTGGIQNSATTAQGTWAVSSSGEITFTPALNFTGSATRSYNIRDNNGAVSNNATIAVTVNPVNDAPVITGQTPSPIVINEDQQLTLQLSNLLVTDPDNSYPTGFSLTVLSGTNYTFAGNTITPATNFNGTLSVSVRVRDGLSDSAPFNVQVQVNPVNDAPVIVGQVPINIGESQPYTIKLEDLIVDDPDNAYPTGFSLSVLSGSNYSVIGNTITPVTNFSGTLTVRVFVNDGLANSTIYNLQIQVNTVNDPPVITGQVALSTNEDTPITIQLANLTVSDPDNNFPADFTLGILSGTNYTFSGTTVTPAANFNGTLTVRVTVNDGQTSSAPFNLQITVNAVNDAPVITGQLPLNTNEDTAIALQLLYLTVTDVDNTYPSGFTLTVLSGTNYTFSGTNVTPAANFNGTLSVSVRVNDGAANSAPFNLQITVNAVNDAPVITGQVPLSTGEDTPITVQLAHLTVADPDNSYPTGFSLIVLSGTNYTVSGAVVTPALDFIGTLTVPVRVNDGTVDSAPFNLQITVSGDNDTPVIVGQVALSTNEDTPLTIKLSDLVVTDPDDPYPTGFTLAILSGTNYTFSGATITPALNFNGTLTVRVTVNDGTTNSAPFNLQVQVNPVNDPPAITGQGALSTNEAQAITIKFSDLTVTDPDNAYPSGFTLTVLSGANYTFSGTTVTPTGAFAGDLFVNVRVNDGASNSNTFQLLITVNGVNDPPTSSGFAPVTLQEDDLTDKTVNLLTVFNDQENTPDQLTYTITGNDNPSYFQTITINQTLGQLVFRMKANVFGTAKVTVRATDGGGLFVQDVLTINITAVNDAPLFDAIADVAVFENAPTQTVQIRNLSAGPLENTQTWVVKATSGNTALIPNPTIAPSSGTGTLSAANLTFKPNASATGFAIITVEITDAGLSTFSRDFRIDVSAINDAPTLDAISNVTVQEDAPQQDITLTGITAGPQETQVLAVTATTNKPELFETFNVIYTSPQNTATLRVKPKANTFGVATITATVTDDGSNVAPSVNFRSRQFTFTIQSVNDAPVFTSAPVEVATVGELYEYVVTVTDVDADAITITAPVKPAWLTLTSQGNGTSRLSGTPPVNAAGPATVRIQARDVPGATVLQDFTIDVNARPIVSDFTIVASEDVSFAFTLQNFADAFTDADGSTLAAIKFTTLPEHGTIRLNQQAVAAGAEVAATSIANLTYLSDENYFGKDTLSWVGSDGSDYSSLPARVFVTIAPVNDAPVVSALETADVTYLVGDGPATISSLFEASDVDNDSLVGAQVEIRQETFVPGEDVLLFTGTQNIQGTFDGQTGILVLTGKAPIAAYSEAIRTVQYNNISLLFIENGTKVISYTVDDGNLRSTAKTLNLKLVDTFVDLSIPNAFTPYPEDGYNDTWAIGNITQAPDVEVKIYNRDGVEVFASKGYEAAWDGTYRDKPLPADTYYYTINLNLQFREKTYKGTITILK